MPNTEVAARLEMRVQNAAGSRFTVGAFDGQNITRIGHVSQFGNVSRQVPQTVTEGVLGMTGGSLRGDTTDKLGCAKTCWYLL
jgi:hypothetical protein